MAAVMESFDTQMVDFADSDDVHMQASHETWFQDETLMEDDVQQLHGETQSNNTEYEDVEIEMDENYTDNAENPEYEMIDEEVADYPVGDVEEEEDIIVADVSHDAGGHYDSTAQFEAQLQSTEPSYISQDPSTQQEQSAASFDSSNDQPVDQQESHPTPLTDLAVTSALPDPLQYPASAGIPESSSVAEVYDYHEHGEQQQEYHEEPLLHASVSIDAQIDGGQPEPLAEPTQANEENLDDHSTGGVVISQDQNATSGQNFAGEQDSHQHLPDSTSTVSHLDTAGRAHDESLTQAESSNEVDNSSVEPPPGVLMSLSSSDQTEIYLFSQPNYPESSTTTVAVHSEILLFEHNPSLYYEPLSTFFDALRQEESIAHWCDLSNSELEIDAYDLQLVISEDNIFSRETSLYDLHQLHEGSGLSGPLRLRLQTVTTRFIVRYRALQEQVYRLSLVTAANEYVEEQESTEHQEEEPVVPSQINETEGIAETYQEELTHPENTGEGEGEGEGETENAFDEVHVQDQEGEQPHDEHDASTLDGTLDGGDEAEAPEENQDSNEEPRENEDGQQLENHPEDTQEDTNGTASSQKNVSGNDVQEERRQDDGSNNENNDHEAQDYQEYTDESPEETTETDTQRVDQDDTTDHPDEAHEGEYEEDQEAETLYDPDGDAAADEHVGGSEVEENTEEKSYERSEYADDDDWDDTFEEDGGVDTTFEEEEDEQESDAISSHVALSTKSSKRSIDEVESGDHDQESPALLDSPGSKRARVE